MHWRMRSIHTCKMAWLQEGLRKLKEKFASPEHSGPKWVADFDEIDGSETRAMRQRDAYERVTGLLAGLGMT